MKNLVRRLIVIVLGIEVVYVVLGNLALNLSLTQDIVNRIRPEKFIVNWESGWTWYPFRVRAEGILAHGQSRSQQWLVEVDEARGSIALLPLLWRHVNIGRVEATNVTVHLRPRPAADGTTHKASEFFPPIADREPEPRAAPSGSSANTGSGDSNPQKKEKKSWFVQLEKASVKGSHNLWIRNLQATLQGSAQAAFEIETRGGPMALSDGRLAIDVESVVLDGDRTVTRDGRLDGELEILPFSPREHRGFAMLEFIKLDTAVAVTTKSLAFLNPYLEGIQGMQVDGGGRVEGQLQLDRGSLGPDTRLTVDASELEVRVLGMSIQGAGGIDIAVDPAGDRTLIDVAFAELVAYSELDQMPLLEGTGVGVAAEGTVRLLPNDDVSLSSASLSMTVPRIRVPDVRAYQGFIPPKWPLELTGGEGEISGQMELTDNTFRISFDLVSPGAALRFGRHQFDAALEFDLRIDSSSIEAGRADLTGTRMSFDNAPMVADQPSISPWSSFLVVDRGWIDLNLDPGTGDSSGARHLVNALKTTDMADLLARSDEQLKLRGSTTDLRWLNAFLDTSFDFSISGGGELDADLRVSGGTLDEGSYLSVAPEAITVDVLDYRITGNGGVNLRVVEGGEAPDVTLDVDVSDAGFRRIDDDVAFVEDVDVFLAARANDVSLDDRSPDFEVALQIPQALVSDMTVYNDYLPAQSPLQILGGEAELEVDVKLYPDDADGFVRLESRGLAARLDAQDIETDLLVDVALSGGEPAEMTFDVTGSLIRLDNVRVTGEQENFLDDSWSANLGLVRGQVTWRKPVNLDLEAAVNLSDSTPIVSMLANRRGKHGWLEKAMTVDDVEGTASLRVDGKVIEVPDSFVSSDNIDVGAKFAMVEDRRSGMVYVRYKKLRALLKSDQGDLNLDVINTRKTFDDYLTVEALEALQVAPETE